MIFVSCNTWERIKVGFAPTFYFGRKGVYEQAFD